MRFASTEITVSVDIAADLTVRAEGAVRLTGDNALVRTNLGEMGSTQIEISGVSEGKGTVSFTVSGARKATDTVVVSVDVTRPTLVISEVSPSNINLLTRETTVVTVSVSAVGNHRSTLTAMVTGIGNSVTPTEIIGVRAGTPATFTVTVGLAARDETLTLTASHPLYDSARTEVDVSVSLRPLELSVEPSPLEVVIGTSKILMIGVSATEGVTLTVTVRDANIIEELAAEYLLMSGETSTEITVRGNNIGDTTLTMTAEAEGYTSPTRTVSIEVLDLLRIEADTDRLSLVEGGDSTELRVSLNRIDADSGTVTVTINLQLGSELTVVPSSLEFTDTETRTVMVRAKNDIDDEYIGIRDETLTLTADDYAMATVTVNITDNDPQPIGLEVGLTELSLVRFASTEITVSVRIAADLMVKAEGAVRLTGDSALVRTNLGEMGSTQIEISGVSEGKGTVTFTVSGDRKATDTVVVSVTVTRPTLVISASADELVIEARTTEALTVSVSAIGDHRSTLTATVMGNTDVASVSPEMTPRVTTATFTVEGLDEGDTTIRLTASRPDYESTSIDVTVNVYFPPVRLNVPSSLQFEERATGLLTVAVIDSTQATITIRSGNDKIASVSSQAFTFMGGETNNSTGIVVNGVGIGMTTLTIEASADGYATETATVMVDVLNRFRIEAIPVSLSLVEGGASTEISVSLSRIDAGRDTVTVTIKLQLGSELTVVPSSLEFTGMETRTVMVRAKNDVDGEYIGIRDETLTLTADDYTTAMVTVEITDDDPQPIGLKVTSSTDLDLVRFASTEITVRVVVDAVLNVETTDEVSLVGVVPSVLIGGADATRIQIRGERIGEGTVTFTVSGERKETATEVVTVTVSKPTLMISASTSELTIEADQTTAGLTVTVSAADQDDLTGVTLTAMINIDDESVASVTPTTIPGVEANVPEIFTVEGLVRGTAMLTLMASHPDYISADTTITVNVTRPAEALRVRIKVFLEGAQ